MEARTQLEAHGAPVAADAVFVVASGRAPERPIFVILPGARGDLTLGGGPTFRHIATSSTGEPIMATPALSEGVMYVRSSRTLFAIGNRR